MSQYSDRRIKERLTIREIEKRIFALELEQFKRRVESRRRLIKKLANP